jgi:hypothetical protein
MYVIKTLESKARLKTTYCCLKIVPKELSDVHCRIYKRTIHQQEYLLLIINN